MDFKELHKPYKDAVSPSVELQMQWLQKIGFKPHQIEKAMLLVYTDIEQGKRFKDGKSLNLYLKETAAKIREEELTVYIAELENIETKLKNKWNENLKRNIPFYKRIIYELLALLWVLVLWGYFRS